MTQWRSGDLVAALIQTGGYSRFIVLLESELLAVASFAWLTVAGLVPGKSARWYNVMTEKNKQADQFREDLSRLLGEAG